MKGKILADNLGKSGMNIPDWRSMCKSDGETIDHLLLHCSVARELWDFTVSLVDVTLVMLLRVKDLLVSWAGLCGRKDKPTIWRTIPSCLMRKVCREEYEQF